MKTFDEVRDIVLAESARNNNMQTSLGDFADGYNGGLAVNTVDGVYHMTSQAYSMFVRDRLGYAPDSIGRFANNPGLQQEIIRELATGVGRDSMLNVQTNGNSITAVLSSAHYMISNADVILSLQDMIHSGAVPSDVMAHTFGLTKGGRKMNLRLIAPDSWNFNLGTKNGIDPGYGGLNIRNDESGGGAFSAGAAIARVACFNWSLAKSEIAVDHRFGALTDFYDALRQAVGLLITRQ